jgi:2,5-diketo-D-gluconate reductase A
MATEGKVTLATGTEMPALGLGTWQLSGRGATDGVLHALELGYRLLDTATDYGSDPHIRDALRQSDLDREELFLEHKVEEDEDAYEATRDRCERLGVEALDLCLIHRPPPEGSGELLWEGLIRARDEGLTREIGVSNFAPAQLDRLIEASGERPAVNQIEWSPFGHSERVLEHARERAVVVQAYCPLTRGKRLGDATLDEVGARHGKSAAQVMLRWCLQLDTPPVPKAADPAHREQNIDVFDFELDEEQMRRLQGLNEHYSALGGLQSL